MDTEDSVTFQKCWVHRGLKIKVTVTTWGTCHPFSVLFIPIYSCPKFNAFQFYGPRAFFPSGEILQAPGSAPRLLGRRRPAHRIRPWPKSPSWCLPSFSFNGQSCTGTAKPWSRSFWLRQASGISITDKHLFDCQSRQPKPKDHHFRQFDKAPERKRFWPNEGGKAGRVIS